MKHVLSAVCFFLSFVLHSQGIISVQMKNSFSGVGIRGKIIVHSDTLTSTYNTDNYGMVQFKSLAGKIKIEFSAENFISQKANYFPDKKSQINLIVSLDPVIYPKMKQSSEKSVLSGYVTDTRTNKPVAGASVSLQTFKDKVLTDKNGYFELAFPELTVYKDESVRNLKRYNLVISKNKYKQFTYRNLLIFGGGLFIKAALTPGTGTTVLAQQQVLIDGTAANEKKEDDMRPEPNAQGRPYVPCSAGENIRLYHNANDKPCTSCRGCTMIEQMSLEQYVRTGLDDEWIAGWKDESLKAGAVAYRTYGAYHIEHPYGANYDIVAFPCRQNWDGSTVSNYTSDAADATADEVLVNGPGAIVMAEYAAETNNFCSQGDGFSGEDGHWPCFADNVCKGKPKYGHGRGMCQWGSHRWAATATVVTYKWILDHYYAPGGYASCK